MLFKNKNTVERQVMIVKADGTTEPFDIEKLRRSLHRAGAKENVTEVVLELSLIHI